jgi:hypothetical protein
MTWSRSKAKLHAASAAFRPPAASKPYQRPFLDLGIGWSPMLRGEPATWAPWLQRYAGTRVMIDGALTSGFGETNLPRTETRMDRSAAARRSGASPPYCRRPRHATLDLAGQ